MRKVLTHILKGLDGTPTPRKGSRQSGQSIVELALVTPILIVLLVGLVEIGWFANNFLSLLDVTRAGARRGATLTDELSALTWESNYRDSAPIAIADLRADYQAGNIGTTPYTGLPATWPAQETERRVFRQCDPTGFRAFYNETICLMLQTMDPLNFDATNGVDDIVLSGFALDMIDPTANDGSPTPAWIGPNAPLGPGVPQIMVVGRYPSNTNECDVRLDSAGNPAGPLEPRDPFDFNENGFIDVYRETSFTPGAPYIWNDDYSEVFGGSPTASPATFSWGYDATITGDPVNAEKQVGFVWSGNHRIPNTNCIGSEWTVAEVEQLFNLTDYVIPTGPEPNLRDALPSQGLLIAEIFWQHKLLLNLPFFTALADRTEVAVWAAFPMQSVQPNIQFNPPA